MKTMTKRQKLAKIHFALGHARRLKILEILEPQPNGLSFEQLVHLSNINESTLGHHVRCLMQAGFLQKTIKGPFSIYRYDPTPMHKIAPHVPQAKAA